MLRIILLLLGLLALGNAWKTYEGYRVYKITPQNQEQITLLRDIINSDIELDVWKQSLGVGVECHIMVSPEKRITFIGNLARSGLDYDVHIDDVGVIVEAERRGLESKYAFDINDWNTYADIISQLDVWVSNCPTGITCETSTFGNSHEGNRIMYIKLSSGSGKPAIWIDSLVHSREWLAGSTVLYMIDNMINNYGTDSDVTRMLDTYDWYFAPVMNPDGYLYTWSDERLWRKNREPNSGSACVGTDLNRNFDVIDGGSSEWCSVGASTNPCSDTYCGASAASAPETQAHQDVISGIGNKAAMVSIHSYANMWLQPFGHEDGASCARSDDHAEILRVGEAAIAAIEATGGQNWVAGTVCETIYAAAGGTCDYAHANAGYTYSYTPELRGNSFAPPTSEIIPAFEETWAGIVAMADAISNGN